MNQLKERLLGATPSIIMGLAIIVSTVIGAYTFYTSRFADDSITVTGSTKQDIVADQAKWVSSISRMVYQSDIESGYNNLANDLATVKAFFKSNGISESDLTISPVSMDQMYNYKTDGGPTQYNLRQTIEYNSSDVEKVAALTKSASKLIQSNILFSTQNIEYTYSKLADLRVSLLSNAVKDAEKRANEIAKSGGRTVGKLRYASSGVVQVLPMNSVEVSDYGMYDTGNIKKQVMLTVKATFSLR